MIRFSWVAIAAGAALLSACGQGGAEAPDAAAPTATRASAEPAGGRVTPADVRAKIARDGAYEAVAALSAGDGAGMRTVERGIASGEQAWLDVHPLIQPGTDGEVALGLRISLAEALASANAAGVLRIAQAGGPYDVAGLCSADSLLAPTPAEQGALTARAITSVEAVNDPALAASRKTCLASLREVQPS